MGKTWKERPSEVAHLLNPAFCCVVLTSSIIGYSEIDNDGIPYPLLFMVLPIALHKTTRDSLPKNIRTSLASWINDNQLPRMLFHERLMSVKPYSKEAIMFGFKHNWLFMGSNGKIHTQISDSELKSFSKVLNNEPWDCVKKARLLGKWFASASSTPTIMALWGIRP